VNRRKLGHRHLPRGYLDELLGVGHEPGLRRRRHALRDRRRHVSPPRSRASSPVTKKID